MEIREHKPEPGFRLNTRNIASLSPYVELDLTTVKIPTDRLPFVGYFLRDLAFASQK
jgi:hypothetical protein